MPKTFGLFSGEDSDDEASKTTDEQFQRLLDRKRKLEEENAMDEKTKKIIEGKEKRWKRSIQEHEDGSFLRSFTMQGRLMIDLFDSQNDIKFHFLF